MRKHEEEMQLLAEEKEKLQRKASEARRELEVTKENLILSKRDVEVLRSRLRDSDAKLKEVKLAGGSSRRVMSDRTNITAAVPTVTRPSIPSTARYSYEAFSNLRGEESKEH